MTKILPTRPGTPGRWAGGTEGGAQGETGREEGPSLSVSVCASLSFSLYCSTSVLVISYYLPFSLSPLILFISLCLNLSFYFSLSVSLYFHVSLPLCLSLTLSLSVSPYASVSLSHRGAVEASGRCMLWCRWCSAGGTSSSEIQLLVPQHSGRTMGSSSDRFFGGGWIPLWKLSL